MNTSLLMPPEIAKAIIAVSKKVTPLVKGEINKYEKYKYFSIDQLNEMIGPLLADVGLVVWVHQLKSEVGPIGGILHLEAFYEIYLVDENGIASPPSPQHVITEFKGAQTMGAAQSYAVKYFLRDLFRIPTGEAELDAMPKTNFTAARPKPVEVEKPAEPAKPAEQPKPENVDSTAPLSADESHTVMEMMKMALSLIENRDQLLQWTKDHSEIKKKLLPEHGKIVSEEHKKTHDRVRTPPPNNVTELRRPEAPDVTKAYVAPFHGGDDDAA